MDTYLSQGPSGSSGVSRRQGQPGGMSGCQIQRPEWIEEEYLTEEKKHKNSKRANFEEINCCSKKIRITQNWRNILLPLYYQRKTYNSIAKNFNKCWQIRAHKRCRCHGNRLHPPPPSGCVWSVSKEGSRRTLADMFVQRPTAQMLLVPESPFRTLTSTHAISCSNVTWLEGASQLNRSKRVLIKHKGNVAVYIPMSHDRREYLDQIVPFSKFCSYLFTATFPFKVL